MGVVPSSELYFRLVGGWLGDEGEGEWRPTASCRVRNMGLLLYIFFSVSYCMFFLFFFLHRGHGTDMYINKRYDRSNSELLIYKNDNKNI